MKSLALFLNDFYTDPNGYKIGQRMGQYFYNKYCKRDPWPDLFHANNEKALMIINDWLVDHQYIDELPRSLEQIEEDRSLNDLVKEFIRLLEIEEETDNGNRFHPTKISSCRVMDLHRIEKLIKAMKRKTI